MKQLIDESLRAGNAAKKQSFSSAKFNWMEAAGYGREHSHFRIGFWIAQRISKRTGKAWPSEAWLAKKAECSLSTVKRAVKDYEKGGFLGVQRVSRYDAKAGMWKTHNIYTLLHDKVLATLGTMRADQCVTGDTLSPKYLELNNSKLKHSSEALSSKHFKNTKDKNTKTQELKRLKQLDEVWSVISKAS